MGIVGHFERIVSGKRGYAILVVVVLLLALTIKNDLSHKSGAAETLCAQARAAKVACEIINAQVVQTEDGSVFLIINEKVYQLQ